MFDFIGKTIAKVFGTKSERDIKEITPYVSLINQEFAQLAAISDDELRARTLVVKGIIDDRLKDIDARIAALHQRIVDEPDLDIMQKEAVFNEIDDLEKARNKDLETVLMEVLPQAFAIVKETARRLK